MYIFFVIITILEVNSIMFHLNPNSQRCLKEELRKEELILGEYDVTNIPGQKVDYVVSTFVTSEMFDMIVYQNC